MPFDSEAAQFLASELGIDPAFIEKDWHATRVLQALSELAFDNVTLLFSGGTSLSKGHGLIQRFSEDLDFRVRFEAEELSRTGKRQLRNAILDSLKEIEGISFNDSDVTADGLGFIVQLSYRQNYVIPSSLRPELQVEFSYTQPQCSPIECTINSMVSHYKQEPAVTTILCVAPLEIAGDKLSSLVWRIHKRNRNDDRDDPTMIRHLHDLCAMESLIKQDTSSSVTSR